MPLFQNNIEIEKDVSLSERSWIKTGGMCGHWIVPKTAKELEEVCRSLWRDNKYFDVVGQTSNIFFHSTYSPEIIVSTIKVNHYRIENNIAVCDAGVSVAKLARECLELGYAGFYGLVGLPGTIASSVYGNAGCFGCSISSMLVSADVLLPDGCCRTFTKEELGFSKRSSVFKRKEVIGVILSVKLKLEKADDIEKEKKKSAETVEYRRIRQEKPSWCLGSVYSSLRMRRNIKNIIAQVLAVLSGWLQISPRQEKMKNILLLLYGYPQLDPYISDKNINTFIWRDTDAEEMFKLYKEFMGKVFNNLSIEIEERI